MNGLATMWLVLLILSLVAEGATAAVTSIWFTAGALVAMVAAMLEIDLWVQIVLFMVVSVGLLIALRPILKKYINPRKVRTNIDSVIGSQGVVLEQIDNISGTGRVKLGGMEWAARSASGATIAAGEVIVVEKIEGVKVFVSTVNVPVK